MKIVNLSNLIQRVLLRGARLVIRVLVAMPFQTADERAGRRKAIAELDETLRDAS